MSSALIVVGSPMRTDVRPGELARAVAEESAELIVFEKQPVPGRIMAAAFDWVAVLGTTADLLAIAGALWAVYVKVITARRKEASGEAPGFLVQVKTEQHDFVQIVIHEGTNEEVFVEEFTSKVSSLRSIECGTSEEVLIEKYEKSSGYRRVRASKDA